MGRPKKYQEGPARYTLMLSPADKAVLERFAFWFQFQTGRRLGIAGVLLEMLRRSPEFHEFEKTGRAAGPMFAQLAQEPAPVTQSFLVPEPVAVQPEPAPAPVTRGIRYRPMGHTAVPVSEPEAPVAVPPAPVAEEKIDPDQLRAALKALGISGNEIARRAGMDSGSVARFLKGERTPKPEGLAKLAAALKG